MIVFDPLGRHLEFQGIRAVRKNGNIVFSKAYGPFYRYQKKF